MKAAKEAAGGNSQAQKPDWKGQKPVQKSAFGEAMKHPGLGKDVTEVCCHVGRGSCFGGVCPRVEITSNGFQQCLPLSNEGQQSTNTLTLDRP